MPKTTQEYITNSAKETQELGRKLAVRLKGGKTIGLIGNLGSGKTVFTKGVAKGLAIRKNVASPTFVLWKLYRVPSNKKIHYLCHIDLYRLADSQETLALGIEEFWKQKNVVSLIEWAEKIKRHLPKRNLLLVEFKFVNASTRKVRITELSDG